MTSTDIQPIQVHTSPAATAANIGQQTAVEQARAIAEVQAAIVVAQQCPRSVSVAVQSMRESCAQMGLAERAFYRYNRAGGAVTGESIHLARELARCWGNMQYGIAELSRDDARGESQMQAFAWDVQTNTRPSTVFIVKHGRDTRDGVKQLTDLRDIYENNANMGARRLREQIFAVLPKWYVEDAKTVIHATLERGTSDKPLDQRIADAVRLFAGRGVSVEQLEDKIGRKRPTWTPADVAQFGVIWKSLERGEITVDEEFPKQRVTAAEIVGPVTETAPPQQERQPRPRRSTPEPKPEPVAAVEPPASDEPDPDSDPTLDRDVDWASVR